MQLCHFSNATKVSPGDLSFTIDDAKPYWVYTADVVAVNSKGQGTSSSANIQTKGNATLKEILVSPESKNMTVNIIPQCLYTGPTTYFISVLAQDKSVIRNKLNYSVANGTSNSEELSLIFDKLEPAMIYNICISFTGGQIVITNVSVSM